MATPLSGFMEAPAQRSIGQNIGRALGGFSAGMQGNGAQYLQQTQQQDQRLDEKRMRAMAQDAQQVYQLLQSNRIEDAIGLMDQRVQMISQLGGDPSDTLAIRQKVVGGDLQGASQDLGMFLSAAQDNGLLGRSKENDPSSVREYEYFNSLTPEQQQQYLGMKRANPVVNLGDRTEVLSQTNPGGSPIASLQRGVSPDNAPELRAAQAAAVNEADIAAIPAQVRTEGAAQRQQDVIALGVDAAQGVPVLRRSLDLLDTVKTGGWDAARIKIKQMFGVESADEGELSSLLGKAVLSQLRSTFGAAFTEREGARLEGIEARMGANPETNKRLLQETLSLVERSANRAIRAAEAVGDYDTADEIQDLLDFNLMEDGGGQQRESVQTEPETGALTPEEEAELKALREQLNGRR